MIKITEIKMSFKKKKYLPYSRKNVWKILKILDFILSFTRKIFKNIEKVFSIIKIKDFKINTHFGTLQKGSYFKFYWNTGRIYSFNKDLQKTQQNIQFSYKMGRNPSIKFL